MAQIKKRKCNTANLFDAVYGPGGGLLYIFRVRGRAIGKGIDFHDFDIRNGIDFRNFRSWYRVGYAFSENWYKERVRV